MASRRRPRLPKKRPGRIHWRHEHAIRRWVRDGLVIATKWDHKPLVRTPAPTGPVEWDEQAVERILRVLATFTQYKGEHRGQPLLLQDWQVEFVVAEFGWIWTDEVEDEELRGTRVRRTIWLEIPRKNGKSTLAAGLGLYLAFADGEAGADVYAAARDRTQALAVFEPAKQMLLSCPPLLSRMGKDAVLKLQLRNRRTQSKLEVLPGVRAAASLHGLNVHGGLIDEIHVHDDPEMINVITTGTGSRRQPMILFITTAGEGEELSAYREWRGLVEQVASGAIDDPTVAGVVIAARPGDNPLAMRTFERANPGLGHTIKRSYLEAQIAQARKSPSSLASLKRLHLGLQDRSTERFLDMTKWRICGGTIDPGEWDGRKAWAGLDLSAISDMTAFVLVARDELGIPMVWPLLWLPEERLAPLEHGSGLPLRQWAQDGWLRATRGNVVSYARVRADIHLEVQRLGVDLQEVAYDPWGATETVTILGEQGLTMVPMRQGSWTMTPPLRELERLVMGSDEEEQLLRHPAHPVLDHHIESLTVKRDPSDNMRPVKPSRADPRYRIDGSVGLLMALDRMMRHTSVQPKRTRKGGRLVGVR